MAAVILLGTAYAQTQKYNNEKYLLVGTYTGGKSEGIYVYSFNSLTGAVKPVSSIKTDNPSFLAIAPNEQFVYAVHENGSKNNPGSVAAFAFNKSNGSLTLINTEPSGGNHPCYVAIDKTGKWVTTGNYTGGSAAVLPVNPDGSLGKPVTVKQHEGKGVNAQRQEKPHVHATVFAPDERFLLVPDLGIDKVMVYAFNKKDGSLQPANPAFLKVADGAGPRHLAFHPSGKFGYLMEEMRGHVIAFKYANGQLKQFQDISSHPDNYTGVIGSADIHVSPDGKFLYASNRGDANSLAIFSINQQTGTLTNVGFQSTQGAVPRNFSIDPSGNFLLVANQNSDNIVIFKRDVKTGLLTDTGNRIEIGKPVCLKWISMK